MNIQTVKTRISAFVSISLAIIALTYSHYSIASEWASGHFTASKRCHAYQSMRKRTNPGHVHLEKGKRYDIKEINTPEGTTWFRIDMADAEPRLRWVYFECGHVELDHSHGHDRSSTRQRNNHHTNTQTDCHTAGEEDSYVFAVSWQPAFCAGHPSKPECQVTDPNSFQAQNFTLHGLWPNKNSCGTNYGFCGQYSGPVRPFCDFDKVPMSAETLTALGKVMPSAAYGSCLQRHEWYKHGTCQTQWDADGYFDTAMRLLAGLNNSSVGQFIRDNVGRKVKTQQLLDSFDSAFFEDASKRLKISCSQGNLVDIYMNLPANIKASASLKDLLQDGKEGFSNRCGDEFTIDPIGQ